ncbi:DASH complex subunit Ask1 [Phytophthora cactorum]|nr:DASH complex subunit Ask1 [Phytophthora cactorum]
MDEDSQQRITYLLQEIDANICAAHRSATQICGTVRRHHQILRQIHEASRVWRPLSIRLRKSRQHAEPLTPGSTRVTIATQRQQHELERVDDEDVEDDSSFISREETFKTTTLKKHQPPSSGRRNT